MRSSLTHDEVLALAQLQRLRASGTAAQAPTPGSVRALVDHRLAEPDEYGGARITERGTQHLAELARRGVVRRAERSAATRPASPFRRRR